MIRSVAAAVIAGGVLVSVPLDYARGAQQLPSEPQRQFGTSITGAFEGWFANPDGSRSFLVGYLNRNNSQALDIPIGEALWPLTRDAPESFSSNLALLRIDKVGKQTRD